MMFESVLLSLLVLGFRMRRLVLIFAFNLAFLLKKVSTKVSSKRSLYILQLAKLVFHEESCFFPNLNVLAFRTVKLLGLDTVSPLLVILTARAESV